MTTYLGYEVLEVRPPRIFDDRETVDNLVSIVEAKGGTYDLQWMSPYHPITKTIEWFCSTRQDIQDARDFLSRRQGKFSKFWVPSWSGDFLLIANASSGASAFAVNSSGRNAYRNNVAIITPTAMYERGIVSYTGNTLTLDSTIPVALDKDSTLICYLLLVRLTADEAVMTFQALDAAELLLQYIEPV